MKSGEHLIWDAHLAVLPAKAQLAAITEAWTRLGSVFHGIVAAVAKSMRPLAEVACKFEEDDRPQHPRAGR